MPEVIGADLQFEYERAFVRACRAAPADELPRAVYADWLDEQEAFVECWQCQGTGWDLRPDRIRHSRPRCGLCKGTGQISNGRSEEAGAARGNLPPPYCDCAGAGVVVPVPSGTAEVECPRCVGRGDVPGSALDAIGTCPDCRGSGQVTALVEASQCLRCGGEWFPPVLALEVGSQVYANGRGGTFTDYKKDPKDEPFGQVWVWTVQSCWVLPVAELLPLTTDTIDPRITESVRERLGNTILFNPDSRRFSRREVVEVRME